jgi:hypothetical protein
VLQQQQQQQVQGQKSRMSGAAAGTIATRVLPSTRLQAAHETLHEGWMIEMGCSSLANHVAPKTPCTCNMTYCDSCTSGAPP